MTYCHTAPTYCKTLVTYLLPLFQVRNASILNALSDNPGAYNKRIRVGRGPSSGKGKTSGRGHKGQRQHGKVPARFQGGQTPQEVVHGERGFVNQYEIRRLFSTIEEILERWLTCATASLSICLPSISIEYNPG